jgi:hypothetical protein
MAARGGRWSGIASNGWAVNTKRVKQLLRSVGEIAKRLVGVLPHHRAWLGPLARAEREPREAALALEMSPHEVAMMRYLVWANFARDGILLGAGKANVGPAGALASMIGSATCVVGGGDPVFFFVCLFVCLFVWFAWFGFGVCLSCF